MKIFSSIILILLSAYYSPDILFAQDPWDLQKCINYALEHNIQIKQQKINTEYNENLFIQSKADLFPSFNANSSYGISFGRALDQTTYDFTENQTVQSINVSLSSNVVLFSGLQKWNAIEQNKLDLMAGISDLEKLKNDISLNVAAAYLQILFNRELLNVAREQMKVTGQQVERTRMLVEAGSVARGNLLEMQAQLAADEVTAVNAENNLNIAYLTLTQILELDSVGDFRVFIPEIETIPEGEILVDVRDIYKDAINTLPEIEAAEYRLESAETGLAIARGSRSPSLSLSAQYGSGFSDIRQQVTGISTQEMVIGTTAGGEEVFSYNYVQEFGAYPLNEQLTDNANLSFFLNLSIPIFNNFRIRNNISNARLMVENNQLELENRENILYKEIQQAYADALAAYKKYNASQRAVASMEESFKYTNEKYEVGLVSAVDFNIAQNQLTVALSDLLQAKYDYIFKINILNFYRGKELKLDY